MARRTLPKPIERPEFDAQAAGCQCLICPYGVAGQTPVKPATTPSKLLVIYDFPSEPDIKHGTPKATNLTKLVERGISQTDAESFTSTYATLCRPPEKVTNDQTAEAIRACNPRLQAEIAAIQANTPLRDGQSIWGIPMGSHAFQALTGRDDYSKWVGGPAVTTEGLNYLPTFGPGYIMSPGGAPYTPAFMFHLIMAAGLSEGMLQPWKWPDDCIDVGPEMERQLQALLEEARAGVAISCDIEANKAGTIFWCIGFASDKHACSVPTGHYTELCKAIVAADNPKIFQNGNYDREFLRDRGWQVGGRHFDTLWQHCITNPSTSHKLEMLSAFELAAPPWKAQYRTRADDKGLSAFDVDPDDEDELRRMRRYNQQDSVAQLKIHQSLDAKLAQNPRGPALYEMTQRVNVIALKMSKVGLRRKKDNVERLKLWLSTELDQSLDQMRRAAKQFGVTDFNPASGNSTAALFFGAFKMAPVKWTPKGKPSLDEDALGVYMTQGDNAAAAEFSKALTIFRNKQKVISTYLDGMETDNAGVIHPKWRAALLTSGRWSSSPNVQNWPGYVRATVEAPEGYDVVAADYSALEARIVAWLAGEDTLIGLFNDNLDVHTRNAEAIFGHKIDHKNNKDHKLKRDCLKSTLYGGLYGGSDETLLSTLILDFPTVTLKMVQAMIRGLWALYPRIPLWQKECIEFARKNGFVEEPIHGRRIPMWRVDPNIAINHHGQGTAGSIVNIAVEGIDAAIDWEDHKLINHVHDELVCISRRPKEMVDILLKHMPQTHTYAGRSMFFPVEPGVGKLWSEAKM